MAGQEHYGRQIGGGGIRVGGPQEIAPAPYVDNGAKDILGMAQGLIDPIARMYREARNNQATAAIEKVDGQFAQWAASYAEAYQGDSAALAGIDFRREHERLAKEALDQYGGKDDETARLELGRRLQARTFKAEQNGVEYAGRQMASARKLGWDGKLATFNKDVADNANDPDWIAWRRDEMVEDWQKQNPGMDPTAFRINLERQSNADMLESLLANGRPEEVLKHLSKQGRLGYALAGFESGGEGNLAIGYDGNGGTSYGKWQLSSKQGSFQEWIAFMEKSGGEQGKKIAAELRAAGVFNTGSRNGAAPEKYRELVKQHGDFIERSQYAYLSISHYKPALGGVQSESCKAMIAGDSSLQEMIWSTAIQHGPAGAARILGKAWKDGMSREDFINAVYDARGKCFGKSTPQVRASVLARFERERAKVLSGNLGGGLALDPAKRIQFQSAASAAIKRKEEARRFSVGTAIEDYLAQCENGIVADFPLPYEQLALALGDKAQEKVRDIENGKALAIGLDAMRQVSLDQHGELLDMFRPEAGAADYAAKDKLFKKLESEAANLKTAWQKNPVEWLAGNDGQVRQARRKLFSKEGFTPEGFKEYRVAVATALASRGLADEELLAKDDCKRLADYVQKSVNPGETFSGFKRIFGADYGNVMKSVLPGCSDTIMIASNGMDAQAIKLLMDAERGKDFEKSAYEQLKMIGGERTEFDLAVAREMEDFNATLMGSGAWELAASMNNATRKLALQYRLRGMSKGDAIERAAKEVCLDRYTLADNSNTPLGFRIPKMQGVDPDVVERGAAEFIREADLSGFRLPNYPMFSEKDQRETLQKRLRNETYWVTNGDESGAVLMFGGLAVVDKDGKPIEKKWDEFHAAPREEVHMGDY